MTQDDIEKLKEIKKLLQEIQAPDKKSQNKD